MKNQNIAFTTFIVLVVIGVSFLIYQQTQKPSVSTKKGATVQFQQQSPGNNNAQASKVLAGKTALFKEFSQTEYKQALKEGKVVFLDFYANWCPICRGEEPNILQGFNELTTDKVIGFRVNFNDSDTDDDEKALAKEFNVPYQHTKIILKNRKEVSRGSDAWEKDTFLREIDKAVKER